MIDFYLRFFQEVENYGGQVWNDCTVLVEYSNSLSMEEALLKAQKWLANNDFIVTKVEFPYIKCYKFEKLKEEE